MPEAGNGLGAVLDNLKDMPSLPTVVAKIIGLIANPKTTASDINAVISRDPGLVTRILKLVNSSFYGFSRRITTITSAVVILGFSKVRDIALSSFVFDSFVGGPGSRRAVLDGLWRHSLGAALFCSAITRRIDPKGEEDAFIRGLLHDLGKFVMIRGAPEDARKVLDLTAREENLLCLEAERRSLSYDHAELGAAVLERWNLPAMTVEVVRRHHDPLAAPNEMKLPTCVANLSDILARTFLMGDPGDTAIPALSPLVRERVGLGWPDLEALSRQVAAEYTKSGSFMGNN
ncbi:MAG: HDOD domain-containing protein [Planctomycetota bacterium]|jgi:putative nucleotidyltransferase with HDIG domain|nr:HDOD domain-containing protein [Planctomycetota bacterium]